MFKASRVKYLPSCTAMTNALDMLCSFVSGDAQGSNFEVVPTWQGCVLPQLGMLGLRRDTFMGKSQLLCMSSLRLQISVQLTILNLLKVGRAWP